MIQFDWIVFFYYEALNPKEEYLSDVYGRFYNIFYWTCTLENSPPSGSFSKLGLVKSSSSPSDEEAAAFRRRKVYKERRNYIEILNDRFRVMKPTVERLLAEIEDEIKLPTNR